MDSGQSVYVNGRIVPASSLCISPLDRGLLYGDGFFETTRIVNGRPLMLQEHLERLVVACAETGFGNEIDAEELANAVGRIIAANGVTGGYLRITVTRGPLSGSLSDLSTDAPTAVIQARPMALPPLGAAPPIVLARSPHRQDEDSPIVAYKSLNYQVNVLALAEARRRGADDAFFLNTQGQLAECTTSNLFLVRDGVVCTPDVACGLLPGITRRTVLALCAELGVPSETGKYSEADLPAAGEAFCTNSLRGIMPVEAVLEYPESGLTVGPTVGRLQQAYAELVRRQCR